MIFTLTGGRCHLITLIRTRWGRRGRCGSSRQSSARTRTGCWRCRWWDVVVPSTWRSGSSCRSRCQIRRDALPG